MPNPEVRTEAIHTQIPVRLLVEMRTLVDEGWFRSLDDLLLEAIRRYVDTHRPQLMERFVREDVEWGLGERS